MSLLRAFFTLKGGTAGKLSHSLRRFANRQPFAERHSLPTPKS